MNWQNYPYHFEGLEKHLERILQKSRIRSITSNSELCCEKHQREFNARMDL